VDPLVLQAAVAARVKPEPQEQRDRLESLDQMVERARLALLVPRDHQDCLERVGLPALLELPERVEPLDLLGLREAVDNLGLKAHQVVLVLLVVRVSLVSRVIQVLAVHLDPREHPGLQDPPGRRASTDQLEGWALKGQMELPVSLELQEPLVRPVLKEAQVAQGWQVAVVLLGQPGHLVHLVSLDRLERLALLALEAQPDLLEHRESRDHLDHWEPLERVEPLEILELLDQRDLKEQ